MLFEVINKVYLFSNKNRTLNKPVMAYIIKYNGDNVLMFKKLAMIIANLIPIRDRNCKITGSSLEPRTGNEKFPVICLADEKIYRGRLDTDKIIDVINLNVMESQQKIIQMQAYKLKNLSLDVGYGKIIEFLIGVLSGTPIFMQKT